MTGTLQAIACIIRDGNLTLAECSARLGISRDQLDTRLRLMERQEYVVRHDDTERARSCTCGHCCASCCHRSGSPSPAMLTLTEKGERLTGG